MRGAARGADGLLPRAAGGLQVPGQRRVRRACRARRPARCRSSCCASASGRAASAASTDTPVRIRRVGRWGRPRSGRGLLRCAEWGAWGGSRLALVLAGLLLAGPGERRDGLGAAARSSRRAEQLRGLRDDASDRGVDGRRRRACGASCCASWRASGSPRGDAAWDDALHLLGVLHAGQTLAAVQRRELDRARSPVSTCRATGRLYVLGSRRLRAALGDRARGGARAPGRALPAHARRVRAAAARPRRRARDAGARRGRRHRACSRATSPRSRRATSSASSARTLGADALGRGRRRRSRISSASSCTRTPRGRSSCAPCGRAAGSACSIAPSGTRRARPRRCSIRRATWRAIRRRSRSRLPTAKLPLSRPRSGPRTSSR